VQRHRHHVEAPRLVHRVLDGQPRGEGMRGLRGGMPERVVRLEGAVVRTERLEPVPQSQEMFSFVVRDADKVVEEGSREVRGDGGVAAEASDDVPGLMRGFEQRVSYFKLSSKNLDLEKPQRAKKKRLLPPPQKKTHEVDRPALDVAEGVQDSKPRRERP
jgi:hypothetical protein